MTIDYRKASLGMLFGMFLMLSHAHAATWTAVASACVPDNTTAGQFVFEDGAFRFSGTNTGTIAVRCNVVNPFDDTADRPVWNRLTVGYTDPDGDTKLTNKYTVRARLVRAKNSNPAEDPIVKFTSDDFGASQHVITVPFTHGFDFKNYAYYVVLLVDRTSASANPKVWYVKLSNQ